jgi:hypothetical protein
MLAQGVSPLNKLLSHQFKLSGMTVFQVPDFSDESFLLTGTQQTFK